MSDIEKFITEIQRITERSQKEAGDTPEDMLHSSVEELGELSTCFAVESGRKQRELTEDSRHEAIDLTICALSVFFAKGGDSQRIAEIGLQKLQKWERSLDRRINALT